MTDEERSYRAQIAQLAPLETFDSSAFVGDQACPQEVCDFVLALAVAFNDLKDLLLGHWLLLGQHPGEDQSETPAVGSVNGIHIHFLRQEFGYIWELTELIRNNSRVRQTAFFEKLIKSMPAGPRGSWDAVVAAADSTPATDPVTKFLVLARNKVSYHYDAAQIGRGYRRAFAPQGKREPFISRGANITETRLYFADAATHDYLREIFGNDDLESFLKVRPRLLHDIGQSLVFIAMRFINARGHGWRSVKAQ